MALCVGFAAAANAAPAKDKLVYFDGQIVSDVDVMKESYKEVVVKGREPVDAGRLRTIVHANAPAAYGNGMAALRAGQFSRAIAQFELVIQDSQAPAWAPLWASVGLGDALRGAGEAGASGKLARALEVYEGFRAQNADHFLIPRVLYGLGRTKLAAKRPDEAKAWFDQLADRVYGDFWELRGKLGRGLAQLELDQAPDALQEFETVIANTRRAGFGELLGEAQAGKGRAYFVRGDYDGAIAFYEGLLESGEGTSSSASADAFVRLAQAYERRARGKDKRKALDVYMRVCLYYAGAHVAYAEALFRAGKLLEASGQKELAEAYFRELKARCAESAQARSLR